MADSLILDSLEIHNFRAFEHLLIEKLGRVNLIVCLRQKKKTPGHVISVIIDREELEIVTRERIEVR